MPNKPTPPPKPPVGGSRSRNTSFSSGNSNPYKFSDADFQYILGKIGAPTSEQNLRVMRAWRASEGGTHDYNPFNTTQPWKGARGGGVKSYASRQSGLDATVDTLLNAGARTGGKGYYANVVSGFRQAKPDTTIQSIVQSPWAQSRYGGAKDWKSSTLWNNYSGQSSAASASLTPTQQTAIQNMTPTLLTAPPTSAGTKIKPIR